MTARERWWGWRTGMNKYGCAQGPGTRANDAVRRAHGADHGPPGAALLVDRRVRRVQLPRPRSRDGRSSHTELALRLVDQVHHVLGRIAPTIAAPDGSVGSTQTQGEAHPTRGGLRIGKPLPERRPDEPMDERLEWDRDGQYFHYLTKWMHALDQVTRVDRAAAVQRLGAELAHAAHRAFTYAPRHGGPKRMYWKLSIDLSRPLVASMGQHDPLDGLVTYAQLEATARRVRAEPRRRDRGLRRDDRAERTRHGRPARDRRPAGRRVSGCAAGAAGRATLRPGRGAARRGARRTAALSWSSPTCACPRHTVWRSASSASRSDSPRSSGTSGAQARRRRARGSISCRDTCRCGREIEAFWLQPEHRGVDSWLEHANINDVMLATSLQPEGFLALPTHGPN